MIFWVILYWIIAAAYLALLLGATDDEVPIIGFWLVLTIGIAVNRTLNWLNIRGRR